MVINRNDWHHSRDWGFTSEELKITVEENELLICGRQNVDLERPTMRSVRRINITTNGCVSE
jgi:hypothetical protein